MAEADIAPGAFGATPPRPAESVTTLAVTLRLVARSSMSNYAAGEIAHMLFATKAKLVSTLPQVGQIEAPVAIFQEVPTVGLDTLDALDHEVDDICALVLKHIIQETMDAEEFQVFAGIVTQVRQAIDKRRTLLR